MTKARDLASGGFGLVLVKPSSVVNGTDNGKGTVSFTGQTTVSLNDVFSSTYDNYRIIITHKNLSSNDAFYLRLRVSGSDNSTSNYYYAGHFVESSYANITLAKGDPTTSWRIGVTSTDFDLIEITISNPFTSEKTAYNSMAAYGISTNEGGQNIESGFFSGTNSFTGFSIIANAGSITGKVSVYGFNN